MSYCTQCNAQLTDNAKFCPNCGTPVPKSAGLDIQQKVGTAKGNVTGLVAGQGSSTDNLDAAVGQTVDTVESGGVVTGAVLGGEGGNIHLGGQQRYGDTVQGNKQKIETGGGAYVGGSVSTGGDFVGRDKVIHGDEVRGNKNSGAELAALFVPILAALQQAPAEQRAAALQQADELQTEVAKGKVANDKRVATLIDGLAALVPSAVSAIVSAFASPLLAGIAGSATEYVLDKIGAK